MFALARTPPAGERTDSPPGSGVAGLVDRDLAKRLSLRVTPTLALIIAALAATIILTCGGHLIYSLDDPYISLSLAWHIAHGEYGVNAGEAASPSSSILYPLLLVGFAWTRWQQWMPAVLNALAALATGTLFATAFCRWGIITRDSQLLWGTVLVVALCIAIDTVAVVFTGLEHSLHALTSAFVVLALARALAEDRVPASLVVAIVLLPLWRFEGIALAILALAALIAIGHRRAPLVALIGIAAAIATYMAAMHALGLPLLPSSVLRKSDVAAQAMDGSLGLVGSILRNALSNLNSEAVPVVLLIVVVVAHPVLRALDRPVAAGAHPLELRRETLLCIVVAGALAAHMVFGAWGGGFARYEAYLLALGSAGALVLWGGAVGAWLGLDRPLIKVAATALLLCVGQRSLIATALTPLSARGVYEMQYEMRRLAVDYYRRPVAVIDLGLVSYKNPYYVLDLWGLGSEAVRRARAGAEPGTAWLDRLVAARQVGLAMVYDNWFAGQIPPGWRRLGMLQAQHRPASFDKVTFYATSPAAVGDALTALTAFGRTTGPGTRVTIFEEAGRFAGSSSPATHLEHP
jgi:hypothetical protein